VVLGSGLAVMAIALGASPALALVLALLIGVPVVVAVAAWLHGPLRRVLAALRDGVEGYREGDFSLRLAVERSDEVGDLVWAYNQLGEIMGRERRELRQRELMLASILEATPTAVLLVNAVGRILVANRAARQLLAGGGRVEGRALDDVLVGVAAPLRREMGPDQVGQALVTIDGDGGPEVLHISRHVFQLDSRRHRLLLARPITQEVRQQEVAVWKRVIRVVGHEINNALAPIRSLLASGRKVVEAGDPDRRLPEILDTIEASAERLHRFVDGYRRMARLPVPRPEKVLIGAFLEDLGRLEPFDLGAVEAEIEAQVDPAQLQQVLLNLVRNAREAGSEEVRVTARRDGDRLVLEVADRGPGMDAEAMAQALVPFWTTKTDGTGLGLTLCREILEIHGGDLRLRSRDGGGLVVTCRLPLER
jgi:nitrogen fixation/metabolism regulation signal transduction histidine kinase